MGRKGQAPEQIIAKLREAEVSLAKGKTVAAPRFANYLAALLCEFGR